MLDPHNLPDRPFRWDELYDFSRVWDAKSAEFLTTWLWEYDIDPALVPVNGWVICNNWERTFAIQMYITNAAGDKIKNKEGCCRRTWTGWQSLQASRPFPQQPCAIVDDDRVIGYYTP